MRYLDGDTAAEIVTPEQALIAAQIVDGIFCSAESGREVELT